MMEANERMYLALLFSFSFFNNFVAVLPYMLTPKKHIIVLASLLFISLSAVGRHGEYSREKAL